MTRVGILSVRVRENLLISSSTLSGLERVSGTTTVNSRTFTPPFPSLDMTEDETLRASKHKMYN